MTYPLSTRSAWVKELFLKREHSLKKVYGDLSPRDFTSDYAKLIEEEIKEGLAPNEVHRPTPFYNNTSKDFQKNWLCLSLHGIYYSSRKKMNCQIEHFLTRTCFKYPHLFELCRQPNDNVVSLNEWDRISQDIFVATQNMALKISQYYCKKIIMDFVNKEDLHQTAFAALWEDILNYHPSQSYNFSTFASYDIKMRVSRFKYRAEHLIPMATHKISPLIRISREKDLEYRKTGKKMDEKTIKDNLTSANLNQDDLNHFNSTFENMNDSVEIKITRDESDDHIDQKKHIVEAIRSIEEPYSSIIKYYHYKESLSDDEMGRIKQYLDSFGWTDYGLKEKKIKALNLLREKLEPFRYHLL